MSRPSRHMHNLIDKGIAERDETFLEIMNGPNPLTPAEVRKMIDMRPALYGRYEKWATPKGS